MYPKLKIDLDNDRLNALNKVWDFLTPEGRKQVKTEQEKIAIQILTEVEELLLKRAVSREFKEGNFFVKLKFYQAAYFYKYLDNWLSVFNYNHFPYEWNVIHFICNDLKQKLA